MSKRMWQRDQNLAFTAIWKKMDYIICSDKITEKFVQPANKTCILGFFHKNFRCPCLMFFISQNIEYSEKHRARPCGVFE